MNKKHAAIIALLITGLIASNYFLINFQSINPERETALITEVLDGDTVRLEDGRTIRLLNINAPEKNQPLSELSTNFLKQYENQSIELEITGVGRYGRQLARLYSPEYLNLELIKLGYVHKYLVDDSEIKEFTEKEAEAIANQLGIWKPSKYQGCLTAEINKNDEYVIIANICDEKIDVSLKDESTRTFVFEIKAVSTLTVYSGEGRNTQKEVYLSSSRNIWNNDKDSLFIRDSGGLLIFYDSYGY